MSSFCGNFLLQKDYKSNLLPRRERLCKTLLFKKADHKMFAKLTSLVNFTNILGVAFTMIFFCQKIPNPNCKKREALRNTLA